MGCSPLCRKTGAIWVMLWAFTLSFKVLAPQRAAYLLHRDFWPSTLHLHNGVFVAPHVTHACMQHPLLGRGPAAATSKYILSLHSALFRITNGNCQPCRGHKRAHSGVRGPEGDQGLISPNPRRRRTVYDEPIFPAGNVQVKTVQARLEHLDALCRPPTKLAVRRSRFVNHRATEIRHSGSHPGV